MSYLEELAALTTELESLNARVQEEYSRRGIPPEVPLVAVEGRDEDLVQLTAEWTSYHERWDAFVAKYSRPGIDPHQIEG